MVGVQTQFSAEGTHITASSHQERLTAAIAKLELALGARKMHAATAGQRVLEVALGAADAVLRQVSAQSFGLRFRVVGFFPLDETLTRDPFVLLLPLLGVSPFQTQTKSSIKHSDMHQRPSISIHYQSITALAN